MIKKIYKFNDKENYKFIMQKKFNMIKKIQYEKKINMITE